MTAPIGAPDTWWAVARAAGHRCECTGECGGRHGDVGSRCSSEESSTAPSMRFHAVPRDLDTPRADAWRLPVADLQLVCDGCDVRLLRGVLRWSRDASRTAPQEDALFE